MGVSVALASLAAAAVTLSACGSEQGGVPPDPSVASHDLASDAEPSTRARPACVQRGESHARMCGLAPPLRFVEQGSAYKLTTIAGESFWAVLPDELGRPTAVVAIPSAPIGVEAEIGVSAQLTTAPAREAAHGYCDGFRECEVTVVDRLALPSGVMTRWDDASGTIRDLEVTTIDLGRWTLVIREPDATRAEQVARALRWSADEDGYPSVLSTNGEAAVNDDWAGVALWVQVEGQDEYILIDVVPGCELSTKQPDLGAGDARPDLELHPPDSADGGTWCADGRYAVNVYFVEQPQLKLLHERLEVIPTGDGAQEP